MYGNSKTPFEIQLCQGIECAALAPIGVSQNDKYNTSYITLEPDTNSQVFLWELDDYIRNCIKSIYNTDVARNKIDYKSLCVLRGDSLPRICVKLTPYTQFYKIIKYQGN